MFYRIPLLKYLIFVFWVNIYFIHVNVVKHLCMTAEHPTPLPQICGAIGDFAWNKLNTNDQEQSYGSESVVTNYWNYTDPFSRTLQPAIPGCHQAHNNRLYNGPQTGQLTAHLKTDRVILERVCHVRDNDLIILACVDSLQQIQLYFPPSLSCSSCTYMYSAHKYSVAWEESSRLANSKRRGFLCANTNRGILVILFPKKHWGA